MLVNHSFTLARFVVLLALCCSSPELAYELSDRMTFWESQAFACPDTGAPFPSKERAPSQGDPSRCEDGDMTLFNGLLCAAGDERGCAAVRLAQDASGRWWRSPRRHGMEAPSHDVSFSPDMAKGVFLYLATKRDKDALARWIKWIDSARPCLAAIGGTCLMQGWPRLCKDDAQDKRCTFRPSTCDLIEKLGIALGVADGPLCRRVLESFGIRTDYILPTTELAAGGGLVNDLGYPSHLAAVEIFLLERLGFTSKHTRAGALALAYRQPRNPFFLYLAVGPTQEVRQLVLDQCPAPNRPSLSKMQWAWERDTADEAWKNSMYWDCIFMGRLLEK